MLSKIVTARSLEITSIKHNLGRGTGCVGSITGYIGFGHAITPARWFEGNRGAVSYPHTPNENK